MPAFDPIRDAILNSPVAHTPVLPARIHLDLDARPPPPMSSPSPSSSSPASASPLTRRATDLAVLLNSDPQDTPLFTPTTPRAPATLSHLLLPADPYDDHDQLAHAPPLRRRPSEHRDSYFSWQAPHPGPPVAPQSTSSRPSTALSNPSRPSTATSLPPLHLPQPAPRTSNPSLSPAPAMPPPPQPPLSAPPSRDRDRAPRPVYPTPPTSAHTATPAAPVPVPPAAPPLAPPDRAGTVSAPAPPRRAQHTPSAPAPAPEPMPAHTPPPRSASPASAKRARPGLPAPPPLSKLPYAPRRRTPAGSVLVPLSPAEIARYRTFRGSPGTAILRKRRRDDGDAGDGDDNNGSGGGDGDHEGARKRRRTGDVGLVVEHYNARPEVGVTQRQESPIIGLKSFNNWVKSVLISRFAGPALAASPQDQGGRGGGRGRVLDMGCGKGGDLTKWAKARIRELVGLDIAAISIDQAQARHTTLRGPRFSASFFPLDCYAHELAAALPPALLARPFDVVSLQFCMHYAFETEQKTRTMLKNVAHSLRPGGVFIGTIPNSEQLLERLDSLPPNAQDLSWGNSVYTIRFEDRASRPTFGHRYWFFLKDAVEDVPEYVVHWDNFVRLAADYGLWLVYKKEFHEVFEEHHEHPEFGPLLVRMKVVDANEESQMDEDQWEAANIYVAFAFEKR